jgi:ubiquinone/menaquinone biosynthesis C-methylase UbiE
MTEPDTVDVTNLRDALVKLKSQRSEDWLKSLSSRKLEEQHFHDERLDDDDPDKGLTPNRKYYSVTNLSHEYIQEWMRKNVPGKAILDYACGTGGLTLDAAKMRANLAVGLDISRASVERGEREAKNAGLADNTLFLHGDCENTGFPSNSFDVILCMGVLHHMDISYAFPELRRILKPGGVILAGEALGYNPLLQLYRNLTPEYRTHWEKDHILKLCDIRFAKRFFKVRNVRYWHLFSLLARPFLNTRLFNPMLAALNAVDQVALRIPPLSYMAWSFTFEMEKVKDA